MSPSPEPPASPQPTAGPLPTSPQPTAGHLPTTSPSDAGVDAAGVLALLDALEAEPDVEMHSLMVLRHGRVLAEGWWAPYSRDRPHLLYSLSKSFTSTALGLAVAEDRLTVEDRVLDHLPELRDDCTEGLLDLRLRHLASMATGHLDDTWERALAADATEPVRGFLGLPPEQAPGSVFAYNQSATYTLATILQRDTGQSLTDYLRPRLLDPLGIGAVGWQQHPPGRDVGFTGLHASTDAIARLGQLYLQRGTWQGRRLLPEAWVEEATRAHVANPGGPEPDWQQGYGYQFWRSRHGYRGDGAYGQFCLVLPDHDLVVATTAGTERMQAVLDAVWQHLLPAVDRPSAPADEAALTERLAHLSLPAYDGPAAAPPQERQVLVPAGGTCEAQPSLVAVEVAPDGDGSRLVLVEDDDARIAARVAPGGWSVCDDGPVPVAATGRSAGDGLDVDVLFLETPHRLTVTTDPAAGTFRARWRTTPLGGPRLGRLHSPSPV